MEQLLGIVLWFNNGYILGITSHKGDANIGKPNKKHNNEMTQSIYFKNLESLLYQSQANMLVSSDLNELPLHNLLFELENKLFYWVEKYIAKSKSRNIFCFDLKVLTIIIIIIVCNTFSLVHIPFSCVCLISSKQSNNIFNIILV